jgi:hypothetical protein
VLSACTDPLRIIVVAAGALPVAYVVPPTVADTLLLSPVAVSVPAVSVSTTSRASVEFAPSTFEGIVS